MFEDREIKVILSNEADEEYEELNKIVGEEKLKVLTPPFIKLY